MAKRVQTGDLREPQPIEPQARPVDTYYQPQADPVAPPPRTNSLLQLAESLRKIQPSLDRYVQEKTEKVTEQQKLEAESVANELAVKNQSDWNTAIRELEKSLQQPNLAPEEQTSLQRQLQLFRSSNPWIHVYYDKAQVSQMAMGLDQAIRTKWATDPVRESDSIADFDGFYDTQVKAALGVMQGKYNDRSFVEEFWPVIQRSKTALLSEHINYRQQQTIQKAKDAFSSLTLTKVTQFKESYSTKLSEAVAQISGLKGLTDDQKAEAFTAEKAKIFQQWGNELTLEGQKVYQMGAVPGTEINELLAKSIIAVAEEEKDVRILELASHVKTGSGPLSGITAIKDMLNSARRQINSERFTDIQRQDALEERERKSFIALKQTEIFGQLIDNPWSDLSPYKKDFLSSDRPMGEEFIDIMNVQRKLQENSRNPVPQGRSGSVEVGAYVYGGGTDISPINKAYLNNQITTDEYKDYGRTVSINQDREKRDSGLAGLKKEVTEMAVVFAMDRYKLILKDFASNRESRIKSRYVQVETEVRKSIDGYIRGQEKNGHSPTRDEINDYIWNKLMPRLDKQFGATEQPGSQNQNKNAPNRLTPQQAQTMINEVNRSNLPANKKKHAIDAIKRRVQ